MRKRILKLIFVVLAVLIIPVSFILSGFCTPSKFSETYYGELGPMVTRLKQSQKKKIIIIGNSSVAFSIDSALIEQELSYDGLDYDVCNFGLYGSIGTKAMMELAENYIKEGDIVIFSPELNAQSMSLYFSAKEMWYAVDSDFSLLTDIQEKEMMVGAFAGYVVDKLKSEQIKGNGVYAKASFDDHCDMKNADRAYNTMIGGYDSNNPLSFDIAWSDSFVEYVNAYNEMVRGKGATMLYSFAPMNEKAMPEGYEQGLDDYYDTLADLLDFLILGNPHDSVMDYEWFFDSNVHLNESGMRVRTISLINDLKIYFESKTSIRAELPTKPEIPVEDELTDEPTESPYFVFEKGENGTIVTGLTEEGKKQKTLVLPSSVYAFTADVFQNNTLIEEVTLPANIRVLYDHGFSGCTSLRKVILLQENPEKISVGYSLLDGTTDCKIYVTQKAFSAFSTNYYWGHYAADLEIN